MLTVRVWARDQRDADPAARTRFYDELAARLRALPRVERVAGASTAPLVGMSARSVYVERPTGEDNVFVEWGGVSPEYFAALRVPVLAGRAFTEADDGASPPVVIVSRAMAERYWPGESPIGRRLRRGPGKPSPWATVVGISADVHDEGFAVAPRPKIYLPLAQEGINPIMLIVKAAGEPGGLAAAMREAAWAIDPSLLSVDVSSFHARLARSVNEPRSRTLLLSLMAILAAVLAVVGVYGVMAFAVTERTLEIGIRMALGAEPQQVLRTVLGRGLALAAAGLGRWRRSWPCSPCACSRGFLFEVRPTDPWTMGAVAAALAAAALAASAVPAWRAARVDPAATLRS